MIQNNDSISSVKSQLAYLFDQWAAIVGDRSPQTWGQARLMLNEIASFNALSSIGPSDSGYDARRKINDLLTLQNYQRFEIDFAADYGRIIGDGGRDGRASEFVSFSRSSTASYFDESGTMKFAPINTWRRDFDPATGAPRGLLVEESRTNLITWSEQLDQSGWQKNNVSISANTFPSPLGDLSADAVTENVDTAQNHFLRAAGALVTAGQTYSASIFVKENPGSAKRYLVVRLLGGFSPSASINVDIEAKTIGNSNGIVTGSANITSLSNGYVRIAFSAVAASSTTAQMDVLIANGSTALAGSQYNGDGVSGFIVWGAQLEAGAFPSSYIPTTTAQVTRAADVCVGAVSGVISPSQGTLYTEATIPMVTLASAAVIADLNDGAQARISTFVNTNGDARGLVQTSAGTQAHIAPGVIPSAGAVRRQALAYATNDVALSSNGVLGTDTVAVMPTSITSLNIGTRAGAQSALNGHIKRVTYFHARLTDAQLQLLTS